MTRNAGWRHGWRGAAASAAAVALCAGTLGAQTPQPRALSLTEALGIAASASEQVEIARAGVT
ncbi:MAG TPA: hypothetical protein VGR37_15980, partial [Longimicrobiaceae bacterium]|nr:hypothetical protein [Longimicrobiaceae bacterium]